MPDTSQNAPKRQSYIRNVSVKATPISSPETVAIPAGAQGTYKNFQLDIHPICNSDGTDIGGDGDTSLVLTSTTFTNEVGLNTPDADMAEGDYWVNYLTGKGRGRKADTGTSMTAQYDIFVMQTSAQFGSVTVDSEFPAAGAAADADANPTTTSVKSYNMGFNGTTWDRLRTALVAVQTAFTGILNVLTLGRYNATPPTLSDGNGVVSQMDARGNTKVAINDGANQVSVETSGSDATSNTQNNLTVTSRLKSFNGSTWDRIRSGVISLSTTLTGMINTIPWLIYNATPTTRTEGQGGPFQGDTLGNVLMNLNILLSGENQSANRLMMSRPGTGARMTTATTTTHVTGTGSLVGVLVEVALTGTLTIYDNTAGSGTIITILPVGTPANFYPLNTKFNTGCTAVTSAADRVVIVTEPN